MREIDRRWVFLCVAVALVLTVLFPFSQPITPSPSVVGVYDFVEKLPPGSVALISMDFDPEAAAELVPITNALLAHCFRRNIRVVGMTFWPTGSLQAKNLLADMGKAYGKVSGTDYVYLGYKPGGMAQVITNVAESFPSAFPKDADGNPTMTMPIFREARSLRDVDYIVGLAAGDTTGGWVVYAGDKYRVPMAAGCTGVIGPDLYVYTNTGQLNGIIAGLRGGADYEVLLKEPGKAVSAMPAQSTVHALIILFVIVGNVLYFASRRAARRAEEGPR